MNYPRRAVVKYLAGVAGYIYGTMSSPNAAVVASAASSSKQYANQQAPTRGINLVLDGMAGVAVHYRGRVVTITPEEIMNALSQGKE